MLEKERQREKGMKEGREREEQERGVEERWPWDDS